MPDRSPAFHLAQVNVSLLLAPLDSPQLAGFVDALDPVNALADASPGFVWRLQAEDGNATSLRVFGDERILINLSVWTSLQALRDFAFASAHLDALRRRREWFVRMEAASVALWWLPAGQLPTIEDATHRLDLLRGNGSGPDAFSFHKPYRPPAGHRDAAGGQADGRGPDGATARSASTGPGATPSSAAAAGSTQSRAR